MRKLKKIVCPGEHKEKILMLYREESGKIPVHRFWVHCGNRDCVQPWIQVEFNVRRGVTVTPMPKDINFDVEKIPYMVINGNNN